MVYNDRAERLAILIRHVRILSLFTVDMVMSAHEGQVQTLTLLKLSFCNCVLT